MKMLRYVALLGLAVVLLLGPVSAPAASAGGLPGTGCPPVYVRVVVGDTLTKIAYRYGVTIWQLQQWNNIRNVDRIYAGTVLVVHPARCARPAPPPKPPAPPVVVPPTNPIVIPPPGAIVVPPIVIPPIVIPPPPGPAQPAYCSDSRAVISSPVPNQQVSGMVTITGNATHENFSFYKLEYGAGTNPNTWSWFFGGLFPIWHGTLGALNTSVLPSGTYTIRVTVVDKTSNYPPPCQVTIVVR